MSRYLLSPRAMKDLEQIWDFSAVRWGEERAESYIREIRTGIEFVASDPRNGRRCDFRADYYRYSVGRHVLFFKIGPEGIDVIRILHQSMDFDRHI